MRAESESGSIMGEDPDPRDEDDADEPEPETGADPHSGRAVAGVSESLSVLVVEDDQPLRSVLLRALDEDGCASTGAGSGREALDHVERAGDGVDVLVIDIGLPDTDGRDLCRALRARGVESPVLFLTARDALVDRLGGFGAGGDDYMAKPFRVEELLARVRAHGRRARRAVESAPALRLDPAAHALLSAEHRVRLTPTEFRILASLLGRPGEVVRRAELMRAGWPHGAIVHDNTLEAYIARLRRKLRSVPGAPKIDTVHGVGYTID
jgi:two-component system response regulator MprA